MRPRMRGLDRDPRIIRQDVQPAEARHARGDGIPDLVGLRHVGVDETRGGLAV
ncbi:hypothetical protein LTR53_020329, partial [Teratosphaeriaceae sp. CCFEE 6253]